MPTTRTARTRRMNLWRLEWLRLVRTPRALALGAVFVILGLIEPAFTRYQSQILGRVGGGVRISFPPPTPAAALSSYVSQVTGIGLIVVVVIAAGAFTFDSHQGLATFLRTRVTSLWQLMTPRFTASAAAAGAAYALGTLAAWYATSVLIAAPPVGAMFAGMLCGCGYLVFAVAVTAGAASVVKGTLGTVGLTLAVLLLLPIVGTFHVIHDWLPSTLAHAPVDLLSGTPLPHFFPALAVTVLASAALLAAAVARLGTREL